MGERGGGGGLTAVGQGGKWFFIPQGELELELDNYFSKFAKILLDSDFCVSLFEMRSTEIIIMGVGIYILHSSAKSMKLSGNSFYFPLLLN